MANCRGKGSSAVGLWLLEGLRSIPKAQDWTVWVPPEWNIGQFPDGPRLKRLAIRGWQRAVIEPAVLHREVHQAGVDCLLALGDMAPPGVGVPTVVLLQQAFLSYPLESLDFPLGLKWRARLAVMAGYLRAGLEHVVAVVAQTHHMKDAFCERWGFPEERVRIIPTPAMRDSSVRWEPARDKPFVLVVVGPSAYKNSIIVPEAARLLRKHRDLEWVVTGAAEQHPRVARLVAEWGLGDSVRFLPAVSREKLLGLMARSSAVLVPSMLESYGLPYMEAMSMGVPLVVSDRRFAREMCGQAALYADPHEPALWAEAVQRLVSDSRFASALGTVGRGRFEELWFPPEEGARRFVDLMREVCP